MREVHPGALPQFRWRDWREEGCYRSLRLSRCLNERGLGLVYGFWGAIVRAGNGLSPDYRSRTNLSVKVLDFVMWLGLRGSPRPAAA